MQLATVWWRARCISCTLALHKQHTLTPIHEMHLSQHLPTALDFSYIYLFPPLSLSPLSAAGCNNWWRSLRSLIHIMHWSRFIIHYQLSAAVSLRGQMKLEELNKCPCVFCVCAATPAWPLKTSARAAWQAIRLIFSCVSAPLFSVFILPFNVTRSPQRRKRVVSFRVAAENQEKRDTPKQ